MFDLKLSPGTTKLVADQMPQDWRASRLQDFCTFTQGGRLGLTKQDNFQNAGVPAYSAAGQDGFVDRVEFHDTRAVVLSAIGANCGRCFYAEGNWTTLANVQVIIPNPNEVDARFLFYRVNRDDYWPRSGSAQPFVKPSDIKSCWVALPELVEQNSIARVLDTLDTTIRQTEAIIAKLKQVKQGLLHDLLTRGIDANGELRPPQSEAPHLYKASPLGWIPACWQETTIGSSVTLSSGGTPSKALKSNWDGSFPLLTPKDMKSFELADTSEHISEKAAVTGSKVMPPETIFVVVRGMILAHSFPVVYVQRAMTFNQDIKAISVGPGLQSRFLAHWFVANANYFLRKVTESTHGTKKLDSEELLSAEICIPPEEEQVAIVARYSALDSRVATEEAYANQLQSLKSGLMDDLLTGRVRVTPLLQGQAT